MTAGGLVHIRATDERRYPHWVMCGATIGPGQPVTIDAGSLALERICRRCLVATGRHWGGDGGDGGGGS